MRPGPGAVPDTPKGPPAPRMAGGPFGGSDVTVGQEALAFSSGLPAAAGTGAGLAAW